MSAAGGNNGGGNNGGGATMGGGCNRGRGSLAAQGPYSLNDVHGWVK